MESTFLSTKTATSLFPIAKTTLNTNSRTPLLAHLHCNFSNFCSLNKFGSISLSRTKSGVDIRRPVKLRIECVGSSPDQLESGGGGGGVKDGDGGSGGGGAGGGETNLSAGGAVVEDVSSLSSDVIILEVGGMTCGGCAASVKRILESQPQVSSANVDLSTEVATVWPASDAKAEPNWQVQLGETLANHLTNCGFKSKLKGQGSTE